MAATTLSELTKEQKEELEKHCKACLLDGLVNPICVLVFGNALASLYRNSALTGQARKDYDSFRGRLREFARQIPPEQRVRLSEKHELPAYPN